MPKRKPTAQERLEVCEERLRALHPDKRREAIRRVLDPYLPQITTTTLAAIRGLVLRASKDVQETELRRIELILEEYS